MAVIVIPARSGSKDLPNKNIKLLNGKPLLAYTIEVAKQLPYKIIVSTDSQEYADIAEEYGVSVPFLRPKEISQDMSSGAEYMKHILSKIEHPEYIIDLLPTVPLREPVYIKKALETLKNNPDATALVSINETPNISCYSRTIKNGFLRDYRTGNYELLPEKYTPRQKAIQSYDQNGYVSVYRVSYILEHMDLPDYWSLCGNRVLAFKTPDVVDLHTQDDFDYLEYKVKK